MAIFRFIANKSNHFNSPLPLSQRLLALSCRCSSASSRHFSSVAHNSENDYSHEYGKPKGELLDAKICPETLVGKSASVLRTFTPKSNAQAFLICGGPLLAAHASFDPMYDRARTYIANRPVGNAVLSPVLISGLVGALVEASFPESFMMDDNMQQFTPLIVGTEVKANVEVASIQPGMNNKVNGFKLVLNSQVERKSDGAVISKGRRTIWLPDYGQYDC